MSPLVWTAVKTVCDWPLRLLPVRAALNFEHVVYHRRFPGLDNPITFNEKIAHRKLFDRDPRLPLLADKLLAKQHVTERLGPDWIVPTIWCGRSLPPRSERTWPIPYVLKASHGSGWNIFVRSREDQKWGRIERLTRRWLGTTYGTATREWAYSKVQPGLLVEPYLGDIAKSLVDYKLFVFGGTVSFIQVDLDRYQNHRQLFFDKQWRRQAFEYACPGTPDDVVPPRCIEQMVWAAERLGASFPFVRVDLYEVGERPLFSELTFYPNAARVGFKPNRVDAELGRLWPMGFSRPDEPSREENPGAQNSRLQR
jgi:hypothetical protein